MHRSLTTRLTDRLTYVAVRVAICVVQSLPRSTCQRLAKSLAGLLTERVKIREGVVRENLQIAFPEWTHQRRQVEIRRMWEHLLLMVVEIAHAPRVIHKTTWRRHLRIHGMEQMVRFLWADRPKVILGVHKAIGLFALSSNAPIMVCSATRKGGLFDYDLRMEGIADPDHGGPETAGIKPVTQWYTSLLEHSIRRTPSQYWWVHRRWRGEPAKAKVAADARNDRETDPDTTRTAA